METKQRASLPQFAEDKRVQSNPVLIAKYSKDGKLLAIVHTDLSLSLWDSEDLLVNTFEKSLFETRPKNRNNTHHVVFLDWSATNKYLYLIIDCSGFQIDVYSKSKRIHSFTFDQPLNSFSAHPILDHFCIVTCLDQLIELNINIDKHLILLNYRDEVKTESARKSSIPSYAEYTGMDDTIILWLQAQLYLIKPDGTIVSSVQLKNSQPLQQRIRIDVANRRCIVACRNEIISYSLPKFEIESSYRDTVNDSPWKSIDYLAKEKMILALPDVYVSEGPTFYLIPSEGEIDSQIYRNPPERLSRGLIHPSGKELLFCDDAGGMILFRRVSETFVWSGPMYPYHFTYLKKNEVGEEKINDTFEATYFPSNDRGIDLSQCVPTHEIDICKHPPESPTLLSMDLQLGEEEYIVMKNVNQLPPAIEDIYGHY